MGQVFYLVDLAQDAVRRLQVAQLQGGAHRVRHAAPDDEDAAPVPGGGVDDLLHAGHQRGEGGDDDPPRRAGDDVVQRFADDLLGGGVARQLGVGGVREQQQHPFDAPLRQAREVGALAADRRVVHLEVPAVDDDALRRVDDDAGGVRDAVADGEQLHAELPQVYLLAVGQHLQVDALAGAALLELDAYHALRQQAGVEGHVVQLRQQVGQGADVVFVAVGDDDAAHLVLVLHHVAHVRDDQVDTQHVLFGEHQAGVDDEDVITVLQRHHVLADLAQPAEGYHLQFRLAHIIEPQNRLSCCAGGSSSFTSVASASSAGILSMSASMAVFRLCWCRAAAGWYMAK